MSCFSSKRLPTELQKQSVVAESADIPQRVQTRWQIASTRDGKYRLEINFDFDLASTGHESESKICLRTSGLPMAPVRWEFV